MAREPLSRTPRAKLRGSAESDTLAGADERPGAKSQVESPDPIGRVTDEADRSYEGHGSNEADSSDTMQTSRQAQAEIQAIRLRKARLAAGFKSGKSAADAHGWPTGTYTADENGNRLLTSERAARYGEAFAVPMAWLLREDPLADGTLEMARALRLQQLDFREIPHEFASEEVEAKATSGFGKRLRRARVDAGFASIRAAARHLGLLAATCQAHEGERNAIGEHGARMYAAAYGADMGWLLTGAFRPPSPGAHPTGGQKDGLEEVARLVARFRGPPPSPDAEQGGTTRIPGEMVRPYLGSERGAAGPFALMTVTEVGPDEGARPGDRIVVDLGAHDGPGLYALRVAGGGLLLQRREGRSVRSADILGRVVLIAADP